MRLASMRPRVFPAEDRQPPLTYDRDVHPASMRPRVFPAEDVSLWPVLLVESMLQ